VSQVVPLNLKKPFSSWRKIIVWIFALVVIYTLVGFVVVPPVVRIVAVKELSRQLGRQVSIKQVMFNPYAFSVMVRGFAIKDTDGGSQPFVSWDEVYVNFKFWSIFGKAWVIQDISVSQPHLQMARNRDGSFNFSDILSRFPTNAPSAKPVVKSKPLALVFEKIQIADADLELENRQPYAHSAPARPAKVSENIVAPSIAPNILILQAVTNLFARLIGSTNQIAGTLDNLEITNCAVHFQDFGSSHPAKLDLTEINFEAKNISNVPGTNMTAQLSLRWNTNGSIALSATAALQPAAVDMQFDLNQLDLGTLTPYLESVLDLYILSSQVGINGEMRLNSPKDQLPQVEFQGDMLLNGFHTVDGVMAQDLVAWSSIWYHGIDVSLNPESVSLKKLTITSPYERVIIETNRTINVYNVLHMASPLLPATNAPEIFVAEQTTASTNAAHAATSSPSLPPISIGEIVITNEAGRFTDRSITPNVNLDIENVNGTISGIAPLRPADINFRATIEGIGTATITGTVYPFSTTATNHIRISLKDVDLTPTSPYAGKFAGYDIAEGKLDMEVDCQVVGRKLECTNVIVLDQFTFGESVNSPDATHLPVRLAIALLKDRDGKIVLNVPIQGSLDDPKFGISKVVQRAVVNILEKVATSPFSLLGAMFGGSGEELSYEDFPAGSAALTPPAIKKLDAMTNALYNRPGLQLEITGSIDPDGDLQGLQRAALDKQIRALIWKGLEKSAQATNSADQIVLSPGDRQAWIDKLYRQAVIDGKITPQLITSDTNLAAYIATTWPQQPLKGATLLMASGKKNPANQYHTKLVPAPEPTEAILLALIPVDEGKFESLAAYRAQIVERYLIKAGVQPSRLFLKTDAGQGLRQDGSRVYLQFR
jgi:Domain of Unknown Function (DUF748)